MQLLCTVLAESNADERRPVLFGIPANVPVPLIVMGLWLAAFAGCAAACTHRLYKWKHQEEQMLLELIVSQDVASPEEDGCKPRASAQVDPPASAPPVEEKEKRNTRLSVPGGAKSTRKSGKKSKKDGLEDISEVATASQNAAADSSNSVEPQKRQPKLTFDESADGSSKAKKKKGAVGGKFTKTKSLSRQDAKIRIKK